MALYDVVSALELSINGCELSMTERETSSGFTRTTTTIALHGKDETGYGEDVTYEPEDHYAFIHHTDPFPLEGEYTFDEFSAAIGAIDLFPGRNPDRCVFRRYRRWGFESAALDLALKQADATLAGLLNRPYNPVRFVVSTRLGDPPVFDRIGAWLEIDPSLEFKLDPTPEWTDALIDDLRTTRAVRILDFKAQYEGTDGDQPLDPGVYERTIPRFPDALIEDPAVTEQTRSLLERHEHRISWDYPITSVASLQDLPFDPRWVNIKPSRFGSVDALFETIERCLDTGISLYGGGQFELGVGREHLHALAALFYPDAPNDIAPTAYNEPEPRRGLPPSPLHPPSNPNGLHWHASP